MLMVSPLAAAFTAAWIVGYCEGTLRVAAKADGASAASRRRNERFISLWGFGFGFSGNSSETSRQGEDSREERASARVSGCSAGERAAYSRAPFASVVAQSRMRSR